MDAVRFMLKPAITLYITQNIGTRAPIAKNIISLVSVCLEPYVESVVNFFFKFKKQTEFWFRNIWGENVECGCVN